MAIMAALAAVDAATGGKVTEKVAQGLGSLGGTLGLTDTATDKARKQEVNDALALARLGNADAVRSMWANAFTITRPKAVHNLYKAALQSYYAQYPNAPIPSGYEGFKDKLKITGGTVVPVLQEILQPVVDATTDLAIERAQERASAAAKDWRPWLIAGGIAAAALLGFGLYRLGRG